MAQVEKRTLGLERVVPDFVLPSMEGRRVDVREYKQKRNLVIAFLDLNRCQGCGQLLREFADNYHLYRDLETEILVVVPEPVATLSARFGTAGLPFPVLSDEHGDAARIYLEAQVGQGSVGGMFITDRFGALRCEFLASSQEDLPSQASILDWLTLIEIECPECGVSEWPE